MRIVLSMSVILIISGIGFYFVLPFSDCDPSETMENMIQITNSDSLKGSLDLHGDVVVWEDYNEDIVDILAYNLSTNELIQITDDEFIQEDPAVYGSNIVWTDQRNGFMDIYMFNLITKVETRITDDGYNQSQPEIFGNRIIWGNYPTTFDVPRSTSIYNIDTKEEKRVLENEPAHGYSMYDEYFAYMGSSGPTQVHLYNISSGEDIPISNNVTQAWEPYIFKNTVVYYDYNFENSKVLLYNITNGTQIRISANLTTTNQMPCSIWENLVYWTDNRGGYWNIYSYNLDTGEETDITSDEIGNYQPIIFMDRVIWSRGYLDPNIFMILFDEDGDGVGDHSDAFPENPEEWQDSDGDRYGDNRDAFPIDPLEWNDTDMDGVGDNSDAFPDNHWASIDTDGDGYPDEYNPTNRAEVPNLELDKYPNDPDKWKDDPECCNSGIVTLIVIGVIIILICGILTSFLLWKYKIKKDK